MDWLQRLLDGLDEVGSSILRVAYLAALITATAYYFGGMDFGALVVALLHGDFAALVPWVAAFAVETQTYITARRVSKDLHLLASPVLDKVVRRATVRDLWICLGGLGALLGFSMWNQLNYLLSTWTPENGMNLPTLAPYILRAVVLPVLFLFAALMAPQVESIGERMNKEAHRTLVQFLKVLKRQRGDALKRLKKQPVDMSQAIEAVGTAANEKKAATMVALVQAAITTLGSGATPEAAAQEAETKAGMRAAPTTKLPRKGTPQDRCRRAYRTGMGWKQLMTAAQVSESTAKRYVRQFEKEEMTA